MPRYRAKTLCFVSGAKIRAGQEFTSDETPNEFWELLEAKTAPAAKTAPVEKTKADEAPTPARDPRPTPLADPWEGKSDEDLRNYIATKGGRAPGPKATREQLVAGAKAAAGSDGVT